jgi:hypothetical protein
LGYRDEPERESVGGEARTVGHVHRAMFYEDRHMSFIDMHITQVRGEDDPRTEDDPGVPRERLRRYRELIQELALKAVGLCGETLTCRASTVGRSSKGYVFESSHPVYVDHLNSHPHRPEGHAHVKLDGRWSLYYGWDP